MKMKPPARGLARQQAGSAHASGSTIAQAGAVKRDRRKPTIASQDRSLHGPLALLRVYLAARRAVNTSRQQLSRENHVASIAVGRARVHALERPCVKRAVPSRQYTTQIARSLDSLVALTGVVSGRSCGILLSHHRRTSAGKGVSAQERACTVCHEGCGDHRFGPSNRVVGRQTC